MLRDMTRWGLIQEWCAAVLLVVAAGIALRIFVATSTGVMLLAVSLVPPTILLLLLTGGQSPTAGDVLRGADQRD
jgi:hypothetical protein